MAFCTIDKKKMAFKRGESLLSILKRRGRGDYRRVLLCKVNNRLEDLHYKPRPKDSIRLLDIDDHDGYRCYQNSLAFLLSAVAREHLPEYKLIIEHSFGDGFYCKFAGGTPVDKAHISRIRKMMDRSIAGKLPFEKLKIKKPALIKHFTRSRQHEKAELLRSQRGPRVAAYRCAAYVDLSFTPLLPDTSYITLLNLHRYKPGFVLRFPTSSTQRSFPAFPNPKKLFGVFEEYERWGEILNISDINALNNRIRKGEISDVIKIAEALHEKKIARIADEVKERSEEIRMILIAGPSASGKTTFSKRLAIQLRVNCLNPLTISIDDYFRERDETPRLPDGSYDFESIRAIDVELLNQHLVALLEGNEVRVPEFDFTEGRRMRGHPLRMSRNQILIIEGIHGLNEHLTHHIPHKQKLKIYISALTQMNIDNEHRISTRDTRILRRMVRDRLFRGHSARETFKLWKNVQRGEDANIFPFQEEADVMFNSALVYELSVLKRFALPLLKSVTQKQKDYGTSNRMLQFLSFFLETAPSEVPPTSILREFIGKSSFLY